MSGKLKALGLALLAATAVSAIGAVSASADFGGHFEVEGSGAFLIGSENATHNSRFSFDGGTAIECANTSYEGRGGGTLAGFTLAPEYPTCETAGTKTHNVTITPNGCTYTFKSTSGTHATFWIICPAGKVFEIHHPSCTIKIPAQEHLYGVSYTTLTENNKHALTVDLTVSNITAHYEGGICVFLGTTHKGALNGSFTLKATDEADKPVHITHT